MGLRIQVPQFPSTCYCWFLVAALLGVSVFSRTLQLYVSPFEKYLFSSFICVLIELFVFGLGFGYL